jgi:hypothetical protein
MSDEERARGLCLLSQYVSSEAHAAFGIGGAGNCPNCYRIIAALRAVRQEEWEAVRDPKHCTPLGPDTNRPLHLFLPDAPRCHCGYFSAVNAVVVEDAQGIMAEFAVVASFGFTNADDVAKLLQRANAFRFPPKCATCGSAVHATAEHDSAYPNRVPEERQVCPECKSPELSSGPVEYGTGVVAPDGVEQRTTDLVVWCRRCKWAGDESDLEPSSEPTEEQIEAAHDLDVEHGTLADWEGK